MVNTTGARGLRREPLTTTACRASMAGSALRSRRIDHRANRDDASCGDSFPAPGISRSITNFGIVAPAFIDTAS
jgi:hypothetical protein